MNAQHATCAGLLAAALLLAGCRHNPNDDAVARAKTLATQSGVAQQVVWSDIAGNTITVIVEPPSAGQPARESSRTVGKTPGDPRVLAPVTNAPAGPVISPYAGPRKPSY